MEAAAFTTGSLRASEDHQAEFDAAQLPPGFRFHPTDTEIIMDYLMKKAADRRFTATAIGEADLNKCEPWDLHKRSKLGEKEWFFFFQRDRKYPTGTRTNRATELGYWKATGKDKEIHKGKTKNFLVGMKKTLVFYKGRAPKGEKTDWVMHEYRLEGELSIQNFSRNAKEEWVVCRVFHKNNAFRRNPAFELPLADSYMDHLPSSLPQLSEYNEDDHKGPQNSIFAWYSMPQNTLQGSQIISRDDAPCPSYSLHRFEGNREIHPWFSMYTTNNSVISPSDETGVSNETTNETKEGFDQRLDDINLSPVDISDLDSFWSY